ncbi:hypothetical protein CHUAL_010228 [Chamberlinius hualienensis]
MQHHISRITTGSFQKGKKEPSSNVNSKRMAKMDLTSKQSTQHSRISLGILPELTEKVLKFCEDTCLQIRDLNNNQKRIENALVEEKEICCQTNEDLQNMTKKRDTLLKSMTEQYKKTTIWENEKNLELNEIKQQLEDKNVEYGKLFNSEQNLKSEVAYWENNCNEFKKKLDENCKQITSLTNQFTSELKQCNNKLQKLQDENDKLKTMLEHEQPQNTSDALANKSMHKNSNVSNAPTIPTSINEAMEINPETCSGQTKIPLNAIEIDLEQKKIWTCTFCTFENPNNIYVCKECCKTNEKQKVQIGLDK